MKNKNSIYLKNTIMKATNLSSEASEGVKNVRPPTSAKGFRSFYDRRKTVLSYLSSVASTK